MKEPHLYFAVLASCLISLPTVADSPPSQSDLNKEALAIVKTFGGTLKPKLQEGIQTGGLEHAIDICAVEAPAIAQRLSHETGWNVKRVSLKPRNKGSATPDAFEEKALKQFDEQLANGVAPASLEYSEIVEGNFRYMKAQTTEAICLGCHGESLAPSVQNQLEQNYPGDVATGYTLGQVRGAFSLSLEL